MLLIVDYIQWSTAHGLQTVDFLRGAEGFKFRFATHAVPLETLLGARTIAGRAALLANKFRLRLQPQTADADIPVGPDAEKASAMPLHLLSAG